MWLLFRWPCKIFLPRRACLFPLSRILLLERLKASHSRQPLGKSNGCRGCLGSRKDAHSVIAIIGLTLANIVGTKQSIDENYPILKANLGGNEFAGFTEDWANYLRASVWIKAQLPMQSDRDHLQKAGVVSALRRKL
jgi:hypothetical protein